MYQKTEEEEATRSIQNSSRHHKVSLNINLGPDGLNSSAMNSAFQS